MKFKYSVIGDNTQENREWLERVGYEVNHSSDDRFLRTYEDGSTKISHFKNWIYEDKQPINCIGNPQLFQAVSAKREDSDKGKCFVPTDNASELCSPFVVCNTDVFNGEYIEYQGSTFKATRGHYRESSLSELQERFKL